MDEFEMDDGVRSYIEAMAQSNAHSSIGCTVSFCGCTLRRPGPLVQDADLQGR